MEKVRLISIATMIIMAIGIGTLCYADPKQQEPLWPSVEGYPEMDREIWDPDYRREPVNENPELYLDLKAEPNDNWPGNPSYDEDLGTVPDSQLKNPDYLKDGGRRLEPRGKTPAEDPIHGKGASAWAWEIVV